MTSLELPFSGFGRFGDFSNNIVEFSVFFVKFGSLCEMHSFSNFTIRFCTVDLGYKAVGLEGYSWQLLRL